MKQATQDAIRDAIEFFENDPDNATPPEAPGVLAALHAALENDPVKSIAPVKSTPALAEAIKDFADEPGVVLACPTDAEIIGNQAERIRELMSEVSAMESTSKQQAERLANEIASGAGEAAHIHPELLYAYRCLETSAAAAVKPFGAVRAYRDILKVVEDDLAYLETCRDMYPVVGGRRKAVR